jgi:predicted SprT family Zn-dependent metalloprotease
VVTDYLDEFFRSFNASFFQGRLPKTTFVPNFQRKQTFFFRSPRIIEVGLGFLEANKEVMLDDLLHSMIHLHNWSVGKPDVTRNQYHRNEFSAMAVKVGLFVAYQHARGWAVTASERKRLSSYSRIRAPECRDQLREAYQQIEWPKDMAAVQHRVAAEVSARPRKQFQFKYVCQCNPPYIVRVGRRPDGATPFKAICDYCNAKFVLDG